MNINNFPFQNNYQSGFSLEEINNFIKAYYNSILNKK